MVYDSVADILAANVAAQSRFEAAVSNLSEAQANFRPAADQWSISELAEHVSIVCSGMLRITQKLLHQAESSEKSPRSELNQQSTSFSQHGLPRDVKFAAPDRVKPKGDVSIEESVARLRESLDGFFSIQGRIEATDLSEETFPHPAFGDLNVYRWMILLGEHQERHRLQIERVKAMAGYPS
jgi:hypothetical protein